MNYINKGDWGKKKKVVDAYVGSAPPAFRSMRGEFFEPEFCFLSEGGATPPRREPLEADLAGGRADLVIRVFRLKLPGMVWLTGIPLGSSVKEPERARNSRVSC